MSSATGLVGSMKYWKLREARLVTGWLSSSVRMEKDLSPSPSPDAGSGIHPEGANPCGCWSRIEPWLSSVVEGDLEISWVAREDRDRPGRSSRHHHQSAQQGNGDQDCIFAASHDSSSRLKRASSGHSTKAPTNGDSLVKSILRILGQPPTLHSLIAARVTKEYERPGRCRPLGRHLLATFLPGWGQGAHTPAMGRSLASPNGNDTSPTPCVLLLRRKNVAFEGRKIPGVSTLSTVTQSPATNRSPGFP